MATAKKKSTATKKKAPAKKKTGGASKKKSAPKKSATKKAAAVPTERPLDTAGLDRKGLAERARQLKLELMAIRFNIQSPSLKDYRKKRRELASVLAQLG